MPLVSQIVATMIPARAVRSSGRSLDKASGSASSSTSTEKPQGSREQSKPSDTENSGRWKKDKPSGAEVIQPEALPTVGEIGHKPPLIVETLSGYPLNCCGKRQCLRIDIRHWSVLFRDVYAIQDL
ncbi:hypothetical protein O3S81_12155 [Agrobacterium sp. SOY23]|uniref:hypothetical protein n=1 Tax=Agrobacterium sp. SOY23 TaxID=3014555 RepID=UPI0022B050C7|nr:hypothetical protein [Agrobacterium sp. SOY23]MCZ4430452.1 hypothetical protein [Agrobacterium sp. SOY23]